MHSSLTSGRKTESPRGRERRPRLRCSVCWEQNTAGCNRIVVGRRGVEPMPKAALSLSAIFLLLAVGWRSFAQYRRTRDFGFRRPARDARPLEKFAGGLLAIGVVGLLASPGCTMAGLAAPISLFDRAAIQVLGLLLACFGIALAVWAEFEMGDSWRVGVDPSETTPLVRRGLFGYIRNPIYTGMLLFALGLLCLVPSLLTATAGLVFVLGIQLQVRGVEEPYLARKHGDTYWRYARTAGRFLPRVGRLL
jgi:protein-S-isoprenylcysteine O-methyltransferase Ste14